MLAQYFVGQLHHFATAKLKTFLFEKADYLACQTALQGAGLEQYLGFFNGHSR